MGAGPSCSKSNAQITILSISAIKLIQLLINGIVIYPAGSATQSLKHWGLVKSEFYYPWRDEKAMIIVQALLKLLKCACMCLFLLLSVCRRLQSDFQQQVKQ